MFKPLIFFIGLRYTRAKRRTQFISFITLTSVMGIALGVTALITVLSVMNGFQTELRNRILGMTAHATLTGHDGVLYQWQEAKQSLALAEHIDGMAPFLSGQIMLNSDKHVSGSLLSGVLPSEEGQVSDIAHKMTQGQLSDLIPGAYNIILGKELADYLGVFVGDKITVISPQINATPAGVVPRMRRFTVVGTFQVGMYEYDRNMAVIHLDDAAKLFRYEAAVSGLRIKLDELFNAPLITRQLGKAHPEYMISDWTRAHNNFFMAIQTEKRVMFIILLLIVAVAAFNIVSTLVMVVTDKRSDIAILKTQGLSSPAVMGIFMVLGTLIGSVGTLLGVIGGVLLASHVETIVPALERLFNTQFMPADVYYISRLPSQLLLSDVVTIAGVAFLLSLLATLYPAWQASKINPAEVLRYE